MMTLAYATNRRWLIRILKEFDVPEPDQQLVGAARNSLEAHPTDPTMCNIARTEPVLD